MASWRFWARVVAIVDLVAIGCTLLGILFGLVFASEISTVLMELLEEKEPQGQDLDEDKEFFTLVLRIIFVVVAVVLVPFLILEIFLFKATKKGVDTTFALKVTKIWRVVYIVVAVLCLFQVVPSLFSGFAIFLESVFEMALCVLFIYVVHKYIGELEELQLSTDNAVSFYQKQNLI